MATAPAIVALVGGTVEEAIDFSRQMREITRGETPVINIPLPIAMAPSAIEHHPRGRERHSGGDHRYRHRRERLMRASA